MRWQEKHCHLMLLLSLLELAFGQLFFQSHACLCLCTCMRLLLPSGEQYCHLMLPLSLLELAFGQLIFNHMRASVCGPVWGCACYLIAAIVITFELLSSHASPVFVRAWAWAPHGTTRWSDSHLLKMPGSSKQSTSSSYGFLKTGLSIVVAPNIIS